MDRFEDFSSMSAEERQEWTAQAAGLSPEQRELLRQGGGLPLEVADSMIDNWPPSAVGSMPPIPAPS